MPLGKLNRDKAFFQDLRDNNSLIRASSFDNQFNLIADFINNEMIPVVDNIVGGAVPGIMGSPNTFLHNIGDGNTDFAPINNDAIPDFVLEFSKLARSIDTCTILATDAGRGFIEVSTNNANNVLISDAGDAPIWGRIRTNNIEDRTITADKIALGTITADNMIPGVLINNLPNGRITGDKFADQALTNPKFVRNSLALYNLGIIWPQGTHLPNQNGQSFVQNENIALGALSGEKIQDNQIVHLDFNVVRWITPGKIAPNCIIDEMLLGHFSVGPGVSNYFTSESLTPNFRLESQKLALDYFRAGMFEPTAQQAFLNNGCFA